MNPTARAHRRTGLRLTVREASQVTAAALIHATLDFLFVGLPISTIPLAGGLSLGIQPAVVVPIFMGLTAGPLAGALVGLAGRFLGDLLAGQGLNGFGLIYSAGLGLAAGLGWQRLQSFRNLRDVRVAFGYAALACVAASLAATLLAQTLIWRDLMLAEGLKQTLSQILSSGLVTLLLISTPLYVWGRRRGE